MSKMKVGCSPLTSEIFAGKVLKDGTWGANKQNVTDTAVGAVAQHLLQLDENGYFGQTVPVISVQMVPL